MRARCKRTPRDTGPRLTGAEQVSIMIGPRMHLDLLLSGSFEREYLHSVMGVLNVAVAAAYGARNAVLQKELERGSACMATLLGEDRLPNQEEGALILACFNKAGRYISRQSRERLAAAILFVDEMISKASAANCQPSASKGEARHETV